MFKIPFYAIRHGETAWNAEGRFQGRSDVPLSDAGRRQARDNAARLRDMLGRRGDLAAPARICASPLARARETAEILARELAMPPETLDIDGRLAEASFGAWEGMTTLEVKARFPEERRRRKAERWSFAPPGGESYAEIERAMRSFLADLATKAAPALIVTHSGNLRVLMTLVAGLDRQEAMQASVRHETVFVQCEGGFFPL